MLLLLSGCVQTLSPRGQSIDAPEFFSVATLAVEYWDRCGLTLAEPGVNASIHVKIENLDPASVLGQTILAVDHVPEMLFSPRLADVDQHVAVRSVAHEIGHAMGLDHVEDPNSVMFAYSGESALLDPPAQTDVDLATHLLH
jgi:hypothetical protein